MLVVYHEWSAINATLKLSQDLIARGYRVVYLGPSNFEKPVVNNGFEYKSYEDDFINERLKYYRTKIRKKDGKMPGPLGSLIWRNRTIVKVHRDLLKRLEEIVAADVPDLVLLGPLMVYFSIPFLKLGIPILNVNFSLITIRNSVVPPTFTGIIPGYKLGGLLNRVVNITAWSIRLLANVFRDWRLFLSWSLSLSIFSFYKSKKEIKKLGGRLRETALLPRLLLPELVLSPREFDFPRLPTTVPRCYAGTSILPHRREDPFDWRSIDKEKPIIYFTIGSYADECDLRDKLYGSIIEVMKQRPETQLIFQIGNEKDIETFKPLPENIFLYKWVPHMQIFPHTSLIICHAGFGTIREAIYFGVPLIVFPNRNDEPGYAARIAYHNLGLRENIKKINPPRLNKLIDGVLHDDTIQHSIKEMQQVFREQESSRKGIEFIEDFLKNVKQDTVR